MLFAAGFGTRMAPLTDNKPKPLIKVAGRTLIDHALDQVDAIKPRRIVVNVHYFGDKIMHHLRGQDVQFSDESAAILETGGGLRAALPILGEQPVFTMNTDSIWVGPNSLKLLSKAWKPSIMNALLLCVDKENTVGHTGDGDFIVDKSGQVRRGAGAVYSGLQIIKTDTLRAINEHKFSLNVLWNEMLETGKLYGVTYPGMWCDVGTPESIALAEKTLKDADV